MSFYYSPKIITDGLIYYQDVANRKSFKEGDNMIDLIEDRVSVLENGLELSAATNYYIQLDGTDDYIDGDNVATLMDGVSECSYNVWVRPEITSGRNYVYSFTVSGSYPAMGLAYTSASPGPIIAQASRFDVLSADLQGDRWVLQTDEQFPIDEFYNVCVTKTSGGTNGNNHNCKIYVNGVEQTSTLIEDTSTSDWWNDNLSFSKFSIGGLTRPSDSSSYLINKFSSFSIYNRALTPTEVLENYNAFKSRFDIL